MQTNYLLDLPEEIQRIIWMSVYDNCVEVLNTSIYGSHPGGWNRPGLSESNFPPYIRDKMDEIWDDSLHFSCYHIIDVGGAPKKGRLGILRPKLLTMWNFPRGT